MPPRRFAGFTLVELMVTVAILAIVVAIGFPSFQESLRSNRVAATTNEMIAALALARSEAVRNTRSAHVCPSIDGTRCEGDWNAGWLVWSDRNGNGSMEADEALRFVQGRAGMVVEGPGDQIDFDARGRASMAGGGAMVVNLRPDQCGDQRLGRVLTVSPTGQVQKGEPRTCS